ncbi:7-cyano-7-deazaguanine synthase QueC [Silvimonas iriomotensis]|uniref:7-cyano-7-deazaguanine synthase n=1 Tax=Silvimonas iriomotensis TaxID=449662 RepID=A0ABQ2PFI8_9NEIS|nr:7-cyano-7-deazaguanine synthase QueC [Silvimonas iriomotensis]GGP23940.1 7-cyano-7-deazaguanine synthase [Silvimonas iriomotensis]
MSTTNARPAVILLSGGLDSATCLAIAKNQGFAPYCLSFDYGQRHNAELKAAARVAKSLGAVEHRIIKIDLAAFGGSALTDASIEVPTDGKTADDEIPVTYVPARNTILLSYALAWAEVLKGDDIFIGVNAVDYSGYPDCRPDYIAAYQHMARLATRTGVEGSPLTIHTPLISLSKAQIVETGLKLGVDYSQTVTCYKADDDGRACGVCDACRLRAAGFADAGVADPTRYQGA